MFSKGSKPTPEPTEPKAEEAPEVERPRPSKAATMPSIVSAGLQVTGNLISDGDVQIEGTIEGDIRSRMLTVGARVVTSIHWSPRRVRKVTSGIRCPSRLSSIAIPPSRVAVSLGKMRDAR